MNVRLQACEILQSVIYDGKSLATADLSTPLLQEICYGVCRWNFRLQWCLKQLLQKPLSKKEQKIHVLLLIGLYQLEHMHLPAHAAINETVNCAKELNKQWAVKFVNAILRNYQRQRDILNERINESETALHVHPQWFIQAIKKSWPLKWREILDANNQKPPMTMRVNEQKIALTAFIDELKSKEIDASAYASLRPLSPKLSSVQIMKPCKVSEIPGFKEGVCSVQDRSAQYAAMLLDLQPGQRVLDACAAPGGKTTHILELQPELEELVAVDCDEKRLKPVYENLERINAKATVIAADVADSAAWWDNKEFDRILLDAPCSATGIIRRHPDIKLLRRESDIQKLADKQLEILTSVWELLKPGGILLYAVCSIMPLEGEGVIERFLELKPEVKVLDAHITEAAILKHGVQLLPTVRGGDGFYYAKLQK